jgi:hypothetical protein
VWFVLLGYFGAVGAVGGYYGHPGLFHFVPLRPYNGMEEVQMLQKMHVRIVGAQWNEVE